MSVKQYCGEKERERDIDHPLSLRFTYMYMYVVNLDFLSRPLSDSIV